MNELQRHHKANFEMLLRAAQGSDLALLACTDAKTGEHVPTLVAVHYDEATEEYVMTPVAKLFTGNPYDEILPPT